MWITSEFESTHDAAIDRWVLCVDVDVGVCECVLLLTTHHSPLTTHYSLLSLESLRIIKIEDGQGGGDDASLSSFSSLPSSSFQPSHKRRRRAGGKSTSRSFIMNPHFRNGLRRSLSMDSDVPWRGGTRLRLRGEGGKCSS